MTARKGCINCNTKPERWDSIYCSDACRSAFLAFPQEPKPPKFAIVERWNGTEWLEVKLTWTGSKYEEIA
jgi:hypothetical protein